MLIVPERFGAALELAVGFVTRTAGGRALRLRRMTSAGLRLLLRQTRGPVGGSPDADQQRKQQLGVGNLGAI